MDEPEINRPDLNRLDNEQICHILDIRDNGGKDISKLAIVSFFCVPVAIFSYIFFIGPMGFCGLNLFSIAGLILGILAVVVISFSGGQLKGYLFTVLPIIFGIGVICFGAVCWVGAAHRAALAQRRSNLKHLGEVMTEYTKTNGGYLPAADKWCDALVEFDGTLTKDDFKYIKNDNTECHYALNKNLNGLKLRNVPGEVVLIFEATGDWNLTGTVELMQESFTMGHRCFVLLANSEVFLWGPESIKHSNFSWVP